MLVKESFCSKTCLRYATTHIEIIMQHFIKEIMAHLYVVLRALQASSILDLSLQRFTIELAISAKIKHVVMISITSKWQIYQISPINAQAIATDPNTAKIRLKSITVELKHFSALIYFCLLTICQLVSLNLQGWLVTKLACWYILFRLLSQFQKAFSVITLSYNDSSLMLTVIIIYTKIGLEFYQHKYLKIKEYKVSFY